MPRYIDANKIVVDAIQERKFVIQMQDMRNYEKTIQTVYADLTDFIAAQPTADVVEVVRCEKCKFYNQTTRAKHFVDYGVCEHPCGLRDPYKLSWCSYGKRKE